jgi:Ca2+-transporting ATPase
MFLAPLHVAFLEMIIDPACSIVFEAEPEEPNVMSRPPRRPDEPLVSQTMLVQAAAYGLLALAIVGAALWLGNFRAMAEGDTRAMAFATLVISDFGLILAHRSLSGSLLTALRKPSPTLLSLMAAVAIVLSVAVSWGPARGLFGFGPLHLDDLALCGVLGIALFATMDAFRWLHRSRGKLPSPAPKNR